MLTALSCSSLGLHAGSAVLSRSAVGGQRSAALFMQEAAAPEGWQAVKEERIRVKKEGAHTYHA